MLRRIFIGLVLLIVAGFGFTVVGATIRYERPVPAPSIHLGPAPNELVAGSATPPAVPLPAQGSLYLETDIDGQAAAVAAEQVRAIGSVAKTMTALVTLEARPLAAGVDGPGYVINAHDVALLQQTKRENGSFVEVKVGETFTERQLLLALMLPSANNLAETLALWIDGSRPTFIAHLNARAVALGMTHTHFDDPSGYSPQTVSTTADLVLLGKAALGNPALAGIVATVSAGLPDGTTVQNLDANLSSQPGWLGIKTGSTNVAGGCLLFAAERTPPGGSSAIRVVGAILGQASLDDALSGAARVAGAVLSGYVSVDPSTLDPGLSGSVDTAWGDRSALTATPFGLGRITVRQGTKLQLQTTDVTLTAPVGANTVVVKAAANLKGRVVATWQLTNGVALGEPSFWWRLTH